MKIYKTIVKKLIKKNYTLSIVESCTGGQFSSAITSVSGSSKIFDLGIVSYSNQAKIKIIKIKPIIKQLINLNDIIRIISIRYPIKH